MHPTKNTHVHTPLARNSAIISTISLVSLIISLATLYLGLAAGLSSLFILFAGIIGSIVGIFMGVVSLVKKSGSTMLASIGVIAGLLSVTTIVLIVLYVIAFATAMSAGSSDTPTPSPQSDGSLQVIELDR